MIIFIEKSYGEGFNGAKEVGRNPAVDKVMKMEMSDVSTYPNSAVENDKNRKSGFNFNTKGAANRIPASKNHRAEEEENSVFSHLLPVFSYTLAILAFVFFPYILENFLIFRVSNRVSKRDDNNKK